MEFQDRLDREREGFTVLLLLGDVQQLDIHKGERSAANQKQEASALLILSVTRS